MEEKLSDEYLKGWTDGKNETRDSWVNYIIRIRMEIEALQKDFADLGVCNKEDVILFVKSEVSE